MYKYRVIISSIVCFICFFSLLSGCKKEAESPQIPKVVGKKIIVKKPDTSQPKKPEKIDTLKSDITPKPKIPKAKENEINKSTDITVGYNPEGRIDPFAPLLEEKPEFPVVDKKKRKRRIPRTPLEKVDLSQLKLVGIIRTPSGNKALVEEASGKGYIITKGTFIGTRSGKVLKILKDRVIVEEEVEDVLGKVMLRKRELKLQKPPGEE